MRPSEAQYSFGFSNQVVLFRSLWYDGSGKRHICPFTGEDLDRYSGREMWFQCFLHVLPKGRYPYFKLNPENIIIASPYFHKVVDQGTEADRAKHPDWKFDKWDALVLEMRQKYEDFKKEHLLA